VRCGGLDIALYIVTMVMAVMFIIIISIMAAMFTMGTASASDIVERLCSKLIIGIVSAVRVAAVALIPCSQNMRLVITLLADDLVGMLLTDMALGIELRQIIFITTQSDLTDM